MSDEDKRVMLERILQKRLETSNIKILECEARHEGIQVCYTDLTNELQYCTVSWLDFAFAD